MYAVDMRHNAFPAWFRGERQYKRYSAYRSHTSVLYMLLDGFHYQRGGFCILHWVFPVPEVQRFVESAGSVQVFVREYREEWDGSAEGVEGVVRVGGGKI